MVGAINRACDPTDLALTAAGGLPGELCKNWRAKTVGTFDCEFGFSCMGYEIAGGWGARMAEPERDVIVFVGDGSYLMLNSDIYSSVMTGHKLIVVVCDNGGFAVINRLQNGKGSASFNNLLADCRRVADARVDFAKHAEAMGAIAEKVSSIGELEAAFKRAKAADRTDVIVIEVDAHAVDAGRCLVGRGRARGQPARRRCARRAPTTSRVRSGSGSESDMAASSGGGAGRCQGSGPRPGRSASASRRSAGRTTTCPSWAATSRWSSACARPVRPATPASRRAASSRWTRRC